MHPLEGHALHPVCFTCVSLLSQEKFPPSGKKSCMNLRSGGGNQIDKLVLYYIISRAGLLASLYTVDINPSVSDTGKLAAQL